MISECKVTTGDGANASTTGDGANASTTGYGANASTTGDGAHASTTGDRANASTTGEYSVASATGIESKAKSRKGFIVIADWRFIRGIWLLKRLSMAKVGGKIGKIIIKPDTWYWFEKGTLCSKKRDTGIHEVKR